MRAGYPEIMRNLQNALTNTAKKGVLTEASFLELNTESDSDFIQSFKKSRLNPLSGIKIAISNTDHICTYIKVNVGYSGHTRYEKQ